MDNKTLKATDIERLENTSAITTLAGFAADECCCSVSSHDNCCKEVAGFGLPIGLP